MRCELTEYRQGLSLEGLIKVHCTGLTMSAQEKTSVSLFSKGGDAVVTRVRSWKMKSIYPEGKPEEKNQAREDFVI